MIVITGGAGFIGSNLVASLLEQKYQEIIVCDRLREGEKWRNLAKHEIAEIVHPDSIIDFLQAHRENVKAIFHMGAISSTVEKDADLIVHTNFTFSLALWEWCSKYQVPFYYASSAATYGDGAKGFLDHDDIAFLKTLRPLNAYGWSKHLFDCRIARMLEEGRDTPPQWVGFKFFNVYGPNEYHKGSQRSVLHQMHGQIRETKQVRLYRSYNKDYEDGGQLRDFVYVKDCCNILQWCHEKRAINGIFNVGSGKARSFNDLAHALFATQDVKKPKIEYFDMPESLRDKYQYFTEGCLEKLRSAGYDKPTTSLEDGVKDYVQNYLETEDAYR